MRTYLHVALVVVLLMAPLCWLIWAMHHDLSETQDAAMEVTCYPAGAYLTSDGQCKMPFELTELVPDLPARMYTGSELVIRDASTSPQAIVYRGDGELGVNAPAGVNCLYWNGTRVTFIVFDFKTMQFSQPVHPCFSLLKQAIDMAEKLADEMTIRSAVPGDIIPEGWRWEPETLGETFTVDCTSIEWSRKRLPR